MGEAGVIRVMGPSSQALRTSANLATCPTRTHQGFNVATFSMRYFLGFQRNSARPFSFISGIPALKLWAARVHFKLQRCVDRKRDFGFQWKLQEDEKLRTW